MSSGGSNNDSTPFDFDEVEDLVDDIELTMSVLGPELVMARKAALEAANRRAIDKARLQAQEDEAAAPLPDEAVINFDELDALVADLGLPEGQDAPPQPAAAAPAPSPLPSPAPSPSQPSPWFDLGKVQLGVEDDATPPPRSHRASLPGGGSAAQRQVGEIVHELAATARSFVLYDPRNDAIKNLLTTLLASVERALGTFSRLDLAVEPFEIHYEGGCVYIDRDWESSLAFKLYRDGVRTLTLERGFDWRELTQLLEILSVRFTGVRQGEDDFVTLFWRAGLRHVHILAVDGVEATESAATNAVSTAHWEIPDDFDLPLAPLPEAVRVPPPELELAERLAFRRQLTSASLPQACLALLNHLGEALADPSADLAFEEIAHIYQEIGEHLFTEGLLPPLVDYLHAFKTLMEAPPPGWDPGRQDIMQVTFADTTTPQHIGRLLSTLPPPTGAPPAILITALNLASPDPLDAVAAALGDPLSVDARGHGRQLLIHYGARYLLRLKLRLKEAEGPLIYDLLYAIAHGGGDEGMEAVVEKLGDDNADHRDAALNLVAQLPYSGSVGRALSQALRSTQGLARMRVLDVVATTGDGRFVEQLVELMAAEAQASGVELAWRIGTVLGTLGGARHLPRFKAWLKAEGILVRRLPGPVWRQIGAAAALAEIPGLETLDMLRAALKAADDEVKPWIGKAISRHHAASQEGA